MDPWVLEGQEWVNGTYADVEGYRECATDGIAGWGYFESLVMGLQHELGISPVVANFGPNTLLQVEQQLGTVGGHITNSNICDLVRYALFGKAYWGGEYAGIISPTTIDAIVQLNEDIGIAPVVPDPEKLVPKAVKALFNSDPFKILDEPTDREEKIQGIQRWLNRHYYEAVNYEICPCDGRYSRNVQQSLMIAVQIEVGISEFEANGIWGPNTRNGLRDNTVQFGDTGRLVQLFHAAGVFNEGFYTDQGGPYGLGFRNEFTSATREFVTEFQKFSGFGMEADDDIHDDSWVNGKGDFNTWAQLLVSCGNSWRDATGSDCITTITPSRGAALVNAGYRSVGRYLHEEEDIPPEYRLDKEIQPGELEDLFAAGLRCFPLWQYANTSVGDFYFGAGERHGKLAHYHAERHGFDADTCIYFAVDYDAMDSQVTSNIIPYFKGIELGLEEAGGKYIPGIYGSRNICSRVSEAGLARWSFVSGMSWGYSGNLGYPLPANWSYNQIREYNFIGDGVEFGLDHNVHRDGADEGVDSVNSRAISMTDFKDYLEYLNDEVNSRGYDPAGPVMGISVGMKNIMIEYFLADRMENLLDGNLGEESRYFYEDWHVYSQRELASSKPTAIVDDDTGLHLPVRKFFGNLQWEYDLGCLYGSWRRHRFSHPDGGDFCDTFMGVDSVETGLNTGFSVTDFLSDTYFGCYWRIRSQVGWGENPNEYEQSLAHNAFDWLLDRNRTGRASGFYTYVFNGSTDEAVSLATSILEDRSPNTQEGMVRHAGSEGIDVFPEDLPNSELRSFAQGFADYVADAASPA